MPTPALVAHDQGRQRGPAPTITLVLPTADYGEAGGAPDWPKLAFNRLKSTELTTVSPVKSARLSYCDCPTDCPKVFFSITKSVALSTLSLLQSPALCKPISCWVEA